MASEYNDKLKLMMNALKNKECIVIEDVVSFDNPGNSEVYALSCPIPISFLKVCIEHFTNLHGKKRDLEFSDFSLGLNIVRINGDEIAKEGLHVHLSHIIALVFEGEGVLHCETSTGKPYSIQAKKTDCIVIPRGALHYFTGSLTFSALEFSDIIDYQKHHYKSIE